VAFALAWACAGFSQTVFSQTIEHGNPLLETLSERLGISTTQAGRGVGAVLAMARGHLTAQDYAVITAAVPAGEQLAEAAKMQGVVTRPIDSKEDLAAVFDQLGIPHEAQVNFVPVMRAWLVFQGAPDAGDLVARVM
jgi:hypothetical protein